MLHFSDQIIMQSSQFIHKELRNKQLLIFEGVLGVLKLLKEQFLSLNRYPQMAQKYYSMNSNLLKLTLVEKFKNN